MRKKIGKEISYLCKKCDTCLIITLTKEHICPRCHGLGYRELSDQNCSYCNAEGFILPEADKYHKECRKEKIKELKKELRELESPEEELNSLLSHMSIGCDLYPY